MVILIKKSNVKKDKWRRSSLNIGPDFARFESIAWGDGSSSRYFATIIKLLN